jgi:hypothetical protein
MRFILTFIAAIAFLFGFSLVDQAASAADSNLRKPAIATEYNYVAPATTQEAVVKECEATDRVCVFENNLLGTYTGTWRVKSSSGSLTVEIIRRDDDGKLVARYNGKDKGKPFKFIAVATSIDPGANQVIFEVVNFKRTDTLTFDGDDLSGSYICTGCSKTIRGSISVSR